MSGCSAVGSALALGARGRQFESDRPDQFFGSIKLLRPLEYQQGGSRGERPTVNKVLSSYVPVAQLDRATDF